jgi:hypothetical protein
MGNEEQLAKLTEAVAGFMESMEVISDAAIGLRADLERKGYSPTMAEQIAGAFHIEMIHVLTSGAHT